MEGAGWTGGWELLVSDSGNQVIRQVNTAGQVGTLAGVPGQAGHFDADKPRQALFNDPRGLAVDAKGNTYVADRGNRVIRRIAAAGPVTTVAGSPGVGGTADGVQNSAQFTNLKSLAWNPGGAPGGWRGCPRRPGRRGHALQEAGEESGVMPSGRRVDTGAWVPLGRRCLDPTRRLHEAGLGPFRPSWRQGRRGPWGWRGEPRR